VYGGTEVQLKVFLTWALDRGEYSALWPNCVTTRERGPSTHPVGGWVCLRAVLDILEMIMIFFPVGN